MNSPETFDNNEPEKERNYPENFNYPDQVYEKEKLLPEDLTGKKFLDVGAGATRFSRDLENLVEDRHGIYIALDNDGELLRSRSEGRKVQADATKLPFNNKSLDIVHSRFLLLQLSREARKKAIQEMDRVGESVMLLEYDWKSWQDKITGQRKENKDNPEISKVLDLQEKFITNVRELRKRKAKNIGELDMGSRLKKEVKEALGREVNERRINGPTVEDYKELIKMGQRMVEKWTNELKDETKAQELNEILLELEKQKIAHLTRDLFIVTF